MSRNKCTFYKLTHVLFFFFIFNSLAFGQAKSADEAFNELTRKRGNFTQNVLDSKDDFRKSDFASKEEWIQFLERVAQKALDENRQQLPEVLAYVGWKVQDEKEFEKAYFYFYKTLHVIPENWGKDLKIAPKFYEYLGLNYYHFRRYPKAEEYLKKSLQHPMISDADRISVLNTLGLIARDLKQISLSRNYTEKALTLAKIQNHDSWIGILSGNLGYLFFLEKNHSKAKELILIDLERSKKNNEFGSWFNALSLLVELEIELNQPKEVKRYMDQFTEMANSMERKDLSHLRVIYRTKSAYQEFMGDFKGALESYRKFSLLKDSSNLVYSLTNIQNTEFQIDFEARQAEVSVLKEKEKKRSAQLLALFLILLTILIAAILVIRQMQKRKKQELEIFQIQKLQVEKELQSTEKEMRSLLSNMGQKNDLIDTLRSEIAFIQENKDLKIKEEKEKMLENLQQFTLLTEEDWIEFKKLFEKMHPGFFAYFQTNHNDVTNAEIRLAALIKLNLSNFEMAKTLGISPESVRKTNLRLRKKVGIESQDDLIHFVKEIK